MSETLRDHTLAWLDSIGADGLMYPGDSILAWYISDLEQSTDEINTSLVPAYRHADGTYHVEPECCSTCEPIRKAQCVYKEYCSTWKEWRAAKPRGVTPEQIVVEE